MGFLITRCFVPVLATCLVLSSSFAAFLPASGSHHDSGQSDSSCLDHLVEADRDGDYRLYRDEYVDFLQLEGHVVDASTFKRLSLDHVSKFYSNACIQCFHQTNDSDCCVQDKANIDISAAILDNDFDEGALVSLCPSLRNKLAAKTSR